MKKILAVAALGSIALSSCAVFGTKSAVVSGQLKGFSPNQNLQIALVGFNQGKFVFDSQRAQVIDKYLTGGFTLSLPRNVPYGTYRLVVFRDVNNDGKLDGGDSIISRDNGKLLVFVAKDGDYFQGTKYGWNIYNGSSDIQTNILNNYDLQAQ